MGATTHSRRTKLVEATPFLLVTQNAVGLGSPLESLLRRTIAGVAIGMVLQCELAVGRLDLARRRVARNTQNRVVVMVIHGSAARSLPRGDAG